MGPEYSKASAVDLIGHIDSYLTECNKGNLPEEILSLSHSVNWPLDLTTARIHIAAFHEKKEFFSSAEGSLHNGMDIQVPAGTPVFAPEESRVIFVNDRGIIQILGDVELYTEKGIVYSIRHLDRWSINERFSLEFMFSQSFDPRSSVEVSAGEKLGVVGEWPVNVNKHLTLTKEVEQLYGRTYDHVHLSTYYYPDKGALENTMFYKEKSSFNPLLLLRKLDVEEKK